MFDSSTDCTEDQDKNLCQCSKVSYTRPGSSTTSQKQHPCITVPHHKAALNQDEPRTTWPPQQCRQGKLQKGNNYPEKHSESGGPTSCRSHANDGQGHNTDHSTVPLPRPRDSRPKKEKGNNTLKTLEDSPRGKLGNNATNPLTSNTSK